MGYPGMTIKVQYGEVTVEVAGIPEEQERESTGGPNGPYRSRETYSASEIKAIIVETIQASLQKAKAEREKAA
jgi:hypothetical protein